MTAESTSTGEPRAAEALAALKEVLCDCRKCALAEGRTQVVFGVGDPEARLMLVGEGPGFHEDKHGEPFVGAAGKLLTELLGRIGLARADVYIANVVKCRPPENRDPTPEEIAACSPHLVQQIEIIKPAVICTLGRFATKLLAESELTITAVHGKVKERKFGSVSTLLFPVFHPAAALYAPANRKVLEEDFAKLGVLLEKGPEALGLGTAAEQPGGGPELPESGSGQPATAPVVSEPASSPKQPGLPSGQTTEDTEQLPLW
jgi:uracil-DNA glycosylase family 4